MHTNTRSQVRIASALYPLRHADRREWETPEKTRTLAPCIRVAFMTRDGRLALESEGVSPLIPIESLEQDLLRRAAMRGEAILRPSLDSFGRTIMLAYVPKAMDAQGPAVLVASLLHLGEAVRQTARRDFEMTNLSARVCVSLIENGSLRRGAKGCGVTYQTAQSEIAVAMQAADVRSQSALICQLARGWLGDTLESERTIGLLMTAFGLKWRDAKVASLLAAGHSRADAGARLGVSKWAIKSSSTTVFTRLGVAKSPELTRVVIDLLFAADLADRYRSACRG